MLSEQTRYMKWRFIIIFFTIVLFIGCSRKIGPSIRYYKKDGELWYASKIYGYPNGKRKLAQKDTYRKRNKSAESTLYDLEESILFYELWPNYEWKFVSKIGFTTYKNGVYFFNNDSVKVPDNVIYTYFDKDYVTQIEVYKDGKRIKYTQGHPDGYQTMQFLRDKPGVYNWKDGKEYFEREFTEQEWESHRKMNEMLNHKAFSDTTKTK